MEDQSCAIIFSLQVSLDNRYVSLRHVQKINPRSSYRQEGEPTLADILLDGSLLWYALFKSSG